MRGRRKNKNLDLDEPVICDAQIPKFNFSGCNAVLNGANAAAVASGKRKLRICSSCERKLKHANLSSLKEIEELIYGPTCMSRRK